MGVTIGPMTPLLWLSLLMAPAPDWGPLQFLVGEWTGEGGGQPGQGAGAFSFTPDLQGTVLVRRSFAVYPNARHDDLMIVYREAGKDPAKAVYFDNEGHVIQYDIRTETQAVVFQSEGPASAPRYRLTYTPDGGSRVKIKFEIAPPGKDFATYLEASAIRRPPTPASAAPAASPRQP
jgi:hypothetical protein